MEKIQDTDPRSKRRRSLIYFLGSLVLSLLITWLLKEPSSTDSQLYVLFLLFFSMSLWITDAIPAFAVALFILAYLVFTLGNPYFNSAPEKIDPYVNTFSSAIIWLLLGGFFIASAMSKTKFDEKLLRLTLRISGSKPRNIFIAIVVTAMIASMIMSNTAATAMLLSALMPLLNAVGRTGFTKALLLGISIATATGGMATIIGTPPNAIAAGMLEKHGIEITFLQWMIFGLPVCLLLTAIGCGVFLKVFIKDQTPVVLDFLKNKSNASPETSFQARVVTIVLIVTLLLWLTSSVHNISVSAVSAIPIVVLTLTGVIDEEDVKALPWDVLFLVAGGMSLGIALQTTGILAHYGDAMRQVKLGPVGFIFLFAFIGMFLSNVMTNAAACAILLPLEFTILPGYEIQLAISTALSTSAGLFFPVSTPPNAIVYSAGFLHVKDFWLGGFLIGLLGPIVASLWVLLIDGI